MQLLNPPRVVQGNMSRCWCAALASLLAACGSPCYTLESLMGHVKAKAVPRVTVHDDGSLRITGPDYPEWTAVAGLFGMVTNSFRPILSGSGPRLSAAYIKDHLAGGRYVLLLYQDPLWNSADGCTTFWHAHVVYGLDDTTGYLMVMDPAFGDYNTIDILPDLTYLASPRANTAAWFMT